MPRVDITCQRMFVQQRNINMHYRNPFMQIDICLRIDEITTNAIGMEYTIRNKVKRWSNRHCHIDFLIISVKLHHLLTSQLGKKDIDCIVFAMVIHRTQIIVYTFTYEQHYLFLWRQNLQLHLVNYCFILIVPNSLLYNMPVLVPTMALPQI